MADKVRALAKKPTKSKAPPSGDFIALGKSRPDDAQSGGSGQSRKLLPSPRDLPSSSLAKKPKLSGGSSSSGLTALGRSDVERHASPVSTQVYLYQQIAREVPAEGLLSAVSDALDRGDDEASEAFLCGAVKQLRATRHKPDQALCLALMCLARTRSQAFHGDVVVEAFCSLLRRDASLGVKAKNQAQVAVLTCNVLLAAFQEEDAWPETFVKVYVDDSIGERVWVDRGDCKAFVSNVLTAFNTKLPKTDPHSKPELGVAPGTSPLYMGGEDDDDMDSRSSFLDQEQSASLMRRRYHHTTLSVEGAVMNVVREQLARRQPPDSATRSLSRLMTATAGLPEVRSLAVTRLEMWLQNPKMNLLRSAQELLMSACLNCDQHSTQDVEVISTIARMRLKNKHLLSHYLACVRAMLAQHPANLSTLMTHAVYNELSQTRNPHNMSLLGAMFAQDSERAAKCLAMIVQDLLANKEDYLRTVRALFREIVRSVRSDMSFTEFAMGLMEERKEAKFKELEPPLRDRLFFALMDMISLTIIMSVSPAVREAAAASARGLQSDMDVVRTFQQKVSVIQRDAVWWLHEVVPAMFPAGTGAVGATGKELVVALRKLLFLDSAEAYHKVDNWPPENDRGPLLRLVSEVPVLEDTLMRVLVIGLTREFRVNPADSIDIAELVVRRAAVIHTEDAPALQVKRMELIDVLFHLSTYKHPDNIVLPKGYTPPSMAISTLYWKACTVLLVVAAYNPDSLGSTLWDGYPTLRCLMEMIMTNNYKFPPPTQVSDEHTADDIKAKERQAVELDKQAILEFEGHLAAASRKDPITEANSLLIPLLIGLDPRGLARRPPTELLEQLRALNSQLKVGQLLCRSREPNFLMDIIKRQGTSEAMPWLAELVDGSDESLHLLPIQCLCEFLLMDTAAGRDTAEGETGGEEGESSSGADNKARAKAEKQAALVSRLQTLLHGPASELSTVLELLQYFLQRLASHQTTARHQAVRGLSLILPKSHVDMSHFDLGDDDDDDDVTMTSDTSGLMHVLPQHRWLLEQLPALTHFPQLQPHVCAALRKACKVETDPCAVSAYVIFLSRYTQRAALQDIDDVILDLSELIVERATLINHILPEDVERSGAEREAEMRAHLVLASMLDLFHTYLDKAQQPQDSYSWSNTQDQILLQWAGGASATMKILVVHAMIILLTYRRPNVVSQYDALLECWFPAQGSPPSAFLVDTSEEALLLPDWLKLRMLRAANERLLAAALKDLELQQLLLFVQSFGIPVSNMSRLLQHLDTMSRIDVTQLEQAVPDKDYMCQLIEVQHLRGVTGGHAFMKLLHQHVALPESMDTTESESWLPAPRNRRTESTLLKTPKVPPEVTRDTKSIVELLNKIFSDALPATDRSQMFRSLQKTLTKDNLDEPVVSAMAKILNRSSADEFVAGLKKNMQLSCPLLRLLCAKKPVVPGLLSMLQRLHAILHPSRCALARLVKSALDDARGRGAGKGAAAGQQSEASGHQTLLQAFTPEGSVCDRGREAVVKRCVGQALGSKEETEKTVAALCELLLEAPNRPGGEWDSGLLVDWLMLLDPEGLTVSPTLQQRLLFTAQPHTAGGTGQQSKPGPAVKETDGPQVCSRKAGSGEVLLCQVLHQSSWESLRRCVSTVLEPGAEHRWAAGRVLDLLWACLHSPGLWRGRDNKLPKHYTPENVLALSLQQIKQVVRYCLQEAHSLSQPGPGESTGATSKYLSKGSVLSTEAQQVLAERALLLQLCCCGQRPMIDSMVQELVDVITCKGQCWQAAQQLLLDVYVKMPSVAPGLNEAERLLHDIPASYRTLSQLDSVSHRVLNTLNDPSAGKKYEVRSYDANIACRKLAAAHPLLMLRQLPLLAALLSGRAQYTWGELKHRNHLLLYTHVLGVLELLQPHVFHKQYARPLAAVFKAYLHLIKVHSLENKQLACVVAKFIKLLHNFQSFDATQAANLLHSHVPVLTDLEKVFPDLASLRSLLAGLVVPNDTVAIEIEDEKCSEEDQESAPPPPRPTSPWPQAQLLLFRKKLASNQTDDVLQVLQDLDETSKRKVEVIQYFMSDMQRLMQEGSDSCRNTAFNLVMRHVRQSPGCAAQLVPTFEQCLDSDNRQVALSALKNLPEFILLAQEHAVGILSKMFTVGITFGVDTKSYICEALQLLNMETMN